MKWYNYPSSILRVKLDISGGMSMNSINSKVIDKIEKTEPGKVFNYFYFSDITDNYIALSKSLSRLTKNKTIKSVEKGVFYKPQKTKYGEINPNAEEIIRNEIKPGDQTIGYITGINMFNRLGFTTQISNVVEIAIRKRRKPKVIMGIKIKYVENKAEIRAENIKLLKYLDILKNIKKIPDSDINESYRLIKHYISALSKKEKRKMLNLSFVYPPQTRALLGKILEETPDLELESLKKSLNPLTKFKLGLKDKKNDERWQIKR